MTEPSVPNLRKASVAIYIAVEKSAADDISSLFKWAANEIERLSANASARSVTIKIPDGYADADEFLKDCQFERVPDAS